MGEYVEVGEEAFEGKMKQGVNDSQDRSLTARPRDAARAMEKPVAMRPIDMSPQMANLSRRDTLIFRRITIGRREQKMSETIPYAKGIHQIKASLRRLVVEREECMVATYQY